MGSPQQPKWNVFTSVRVQGMGQQGKNGQYRLLNEIFRDDLGPLMRTCARIQFTTSVQA